MRDTRVISELQGESRTLPKNYVSYLFGDIAIPQYMTVGQRMDAAAPDGERRILQLIYLTGE